jgi:hypothetical protein
VQESVPEVLLLRERVSAQEEEMESLRATVRERDAVLHEKAALIRDLEER